MVIFNQNQLNSETFDNLAKDYFRMKTFKYVVWYYVYI